MVDNIIRINELPPEASPTSSEVIAIDGTTTRKATISAIAAAGRPFASQSEAETGTNATKTMTPLTTRQSINYYGTIAFASAAQGLLADTALQPAVRNRYGEFPECITGGVTDNLAIIQAAIDSAVENGTNNVQLPPGTFALSDYLLISTTGFSLRGCGKEITKLVVTTAETSGLFIKSTSGDAIYSIDVRDLSIYVADAVADDATDCIGIDIENVAGAYIDVDVYNFGVNYRLAGVFDVKIDKITSQCFQNTPNDRRIMYITKASAPYGGAYGGNIYLANCDMRSRANQGFPGCAKILHVDAVDGLFVDNCYMGYADEYTAHIEKISGEFISGVKWNGGWVDSHTNQGMVWDGTSGALNGPCSITATQFYGGGTTTRNCAVLGDWANVQITGCVFDSSNGDNVTIQTTGQGVQVVGNKFNRADGDATGGGEGINVADTDSVLIAANVIQGYDFTDNGIAVDNGTRIQIVNNHVRGCQNGISTSGTLDQYMITGNMALDNTINNILDLASGATKLVSGNLS